MYRERKEYNSIQPENNLLVFYAIRRRDYDMVKLLYSSSCLQQDISNAHMPHRSVPERD